MSLIQISILSNFDLCHSVNTEIFRLKFLLEVNLFQAFAFDSKFEPWKWIAGLKGQFEVVNVVQGFGLYQVYDMKFARINVEFLISEALDCQKRLFILINAIFDIVCVTFFAKKISFWHKWE